MEIVFKKWTGLPKMELDHMLCFEGEGKQSGFVVDVESEEPEDEVQQVASKMKKL